MDNKIEELISELKMEKERAHYDADYYRSVGTDFLFYQKFGETQALSFCINKLIALKNEQPEAITDDSHCRKHEVGGSTASEETSSLKTDQGEASSETPIVGGNKQTKEVAKPNDESRDKYGRTFDEWAEDEFCR